MTSRKTTTKDATTETPEVKVATKKDPEAKVVAKKDPETKATPKKDPEAKPKTKKEPEAKTTTKKEPEAKTTPKKEPEAKTTPKKEPEPKPTAKKEPEPKPTPKKEPEPKPTPKKEPEAKTTPKKEPEPKPAPKKEPEVKAAEPQEPEYESMDALLKASSPDIPALKKGDVVTGKISGITESHIIISLGTKQDGYAEIGDYLEGGAGLTLKIGDDIRGFIVRMTDDQIVISKSLNRSHGNKVLIREAFTQHIPVKGKVVEARKGGFHVDVFGVRAFCPGSHMDVSTNSNLKPEYYLQQTFDFDIIEFQKGNIILSRKNLLMRDLAAKKESVFSRINVGDIVKGLVNRITTFGAFIDLGGVEGLLHISEISWQHITKPEDVLKMGEEIEVKILSIQGEKISLSIKALTENPLKLAIVNYHVDDEVKCTIIRHEKYGTFVELEKGVEGLIPFSLMPKRRRFAQQDGQANALKIGDEVTAKIVKIDPNTLKISLSMKDDDTNYWFAEVADLQEGMEIEGTIQNVSDHGLFIKVKDNVTGLMPQSKVKRSKQVYKHDDVGKTITVRISRIDTEQQRLSLEPLDYQNYDDYYDSMPDDDGKKIGKRNQNAPRGSSSYDRDKRDQRHSSRKQRNEGQGSSKEHSGDSEWKKYTTDYQSVPEDNPFNDL